MAGNKSNFFSYKGLPLVRKGKQLYFGNMYDDYVVMIDILETEKQGDLDVANKVRILKMATDFTLPPNEQIVKTSLRNAASMKRLILPVLG